MKTVEYVCSTCKVNFSVPKYRRNVKFCSRSCASIGMRAEPNCTCTCCGKSFYLKKSVMTRSARSLGYFCSNVCLAKFKSEAYLGSKNPNYRGRNSDEDGYRIYPQNAIYYREFRNMKLHQAVCCQILGIPKIPSGYHVHHKDCDVRNNAPENLSVLRISDHKWLHKQYGSATLWAIEHEKLSIDDATSWACDRDRAKTLLTLTVIDQHKDNFTEVDELSTTDRRTGGFGSTGA